MIEAGYFIEGIELEDPVKAIREISRDPTLKKKVKLDDGREFSALEIQRVYLEKASEYLHDRPYDKVLADVLTEWERVLNALADDPMQLVQVRSIG